jgi:hypothetical protein
MGYGNISMLEKVICFMECIKNKMDDADYKQYGLFLCLLFIFIKITVNIILA